MEAHDSPRVPRRDAAVVVGFATLVAITLWRHEPWRDELQAWMIVRASTTPTTLFRNLRHEGHPFLWYAVLWPLARASSSIVMLQCLQWCIAVATAAVVVLRAPFRFSMRVAIVFGYFALFEYGTIARSYGLGVLLFVVALSIVQSRPRGFAFGLALGLLALTSAFGTILAIATLVAVAIRNARSEDLTARRATLTSTALVLVACAIAYIQARPNGATGAFTQWRTSFDAHLASTAFASVFRAVVPIPKLQASWWNTNISDGHTGVAAIASAFIILGVAWALRRHRDAVALWLTTTLGTVAFLYVKLQQADGARYYGHIWLAFVAAMWLAATDTPHGAPSPAPRHARPFALLTWIHVAVAAFAVVSDARRPFTDASEIAAQIRARTTNASIIACPDFAGSSIAGHLDRRIYYPQGARNGTFVEWDVRRTRVIAKPDDARRDAMRGHRTPELLVLNHAEPLLQAQLWASERRGVVADEHYWVYDITGRALPELPNPCRTP